MRTEIVSVTAALIASALCAAEPELKEIKGQSSWIIRNDQVELALTQRGGHMAPVTFYRAESKTVQPYHVTPWQGETLPPDLCPVMVPLRGDFFCLPFGGNGTAYKGESFPPHGETCGSPWTLVGSEKKGAVTTLTMALETKARPGKVTRELSLVDGQNVVYSRSQVDGFIGKSSVAHHVILAMPEKEGVIKISTSPIKFGMTCPWLFSDPAKGEYQSFAIGAEFRSLEKVPLRFKDLPTADCTSFPARRGYADLLEMFEDPAAPTKGQPSWITAVNTEDGWLWFALKNPAVQPGRVFWIENHGRYGAPWNGRNNCLGIEDGCMYFDKGIAESCEPNLITRKGVPTCVELKAGQPFAVNYVQGVVKVPAGFGKVAKLRFEPHKVVFVGANGQEVVAAVEHQFVWSGELSR